MKLRLDLFSGLGGASEAMITSSDWAVLRYDNNPDLMHIPGTSLCDLQHYQINIRHRIDVIWASPPCLDFSHAFNAPGPTAQREGIDFEPDMSLLERAIEIIQDLEPTYWVIENVRGAIKHFSPYLGEPRQIIGPFVLWGNYPLLALERDTDFKKEFNKTNSKTPLRSNIHARIPIEISQALKDAIENQKTIADY